MTPFFKRLRPGWPGYVLVLTLACWSSIAVGAEIKECRVGFAGAYKVGHWTPMWVDVAGDIDAAKTVEVTANDSDGIPATVFAPVPSKLSPDSPTTMPLNMQVGRMGGRIAVELRSDEKVIDRAELQPGATRGDQAALTDLPATGELLVAVGAEKFGWSEAFPNRGATDGHVIRLCSTAEAR